MQIEKSTFDTELDSLMEIERQARQLNDMDLSLSTSLKVFDLLQRNNDVKKLMATVTLLCNKRGQFTRTVSEVIKKCMEMTEKLKNAEEKIEFVQAIKDICEKKIYLEVEYARCAMILVKYNEKDGKNLAEAAKIIENVQVETYGSMSKYEKIDFILYQMKLNILLQDNTKLYIVSKKVNKKFLDEAGFHPLKFTFNLYSFKHYLTTSDFATASTCLEDAYDALLLFKPDEIEGLDSLVKSQFSRFLEKVTLAESANAFRLLEQFSNSKIEKIQAMKVKFEQVLAEKSSILGLIDSFLSREITICETKFYGSDSIFIFGSEFEGHKELVQTLAKELVSKNVYIASRFYRAVKLGRLTELFKAERGLIEEQICSLIVEKKVGGKINRPEGIVRFSQENNATAELDSWAGNVNRLVELVDFVCERIEREEVVQSA